MVFKVSSPDQWKQRVGLLSKLRRVTHFPVTRVPCDRNRNMFMGFFLQFHILLSVRAKRTEDFLFQSRWDARIFTCLFCLFQISFPICSLCVNEKKWFVSPCRLWWGQLLIFWRLGRYSGTAVTVCIRDNQQHMRKKINPAQMCWHLIFFSCTASIWMFS